MPEDYAPPPPTPTPPPPPPYTRNYGAPAPPYGVGAPYGAPPRRRSAWFYIGIIGGCMVAVFLLFTSMVWYTARSFNGSSGGLDFGKRIAVIDISGVILSPDAVDTQLRRFGDDDSVKAIILHINSPGGGAAASQEIYHEVLRVRMTKHKKVVASVESVGASGAYYIASACDKIYANDASVVGSIGVIMEWTNYGDLLKWAKLKNITISRGDLKDAGDPSRDLTPQEQAYFQSLVDNMYGQFIHDVAVGRHTTEDKIRPLATGQVWTGEQALPLGLIDQVGGYRTALLDTAREVGISGEPTIVRPPSNKRGLLSLLTDDGEDLFPNPSKLLDRSPGFYFMWK
ncbi:signal peptide peptidase SppA [Edaphobacter sp.]|uniref:signal peptide peptidase SppA n=1 Tax=Edaphobacter sp. TaxID=1934404 RepID=UPI002DBC69C9|nr:signal peptide peptidase SppA [Edaphobacter sp.]HEU5342362.1 signal peptide peptidase SppA [Edaphobacter sp.]